MHNGIPNFRKSSNAEFVQMHHANAVILNIENFAKRRSLFRKTGQTWK